jgi:hypothetical protein
LSKSELKTLAHRIFLLTRRGIWRGGKVVLDGPNRWNGTRVNPAWPKGLDEPDEDVWGVGTTWTLSPAVELGGHELRVCVASHPNKEGYEVRVFVDGDLKYPGGVYAGNDWWLFAEMFPSWAARIARIEREDGGVSGPIDRRDLLIAEAGQRLRGPQQVNHPQPEPESDPAAVAAVREVEALVKKISQ